MKGRDEDEESEFRKRFSSNTSGTAVNGNWKRICLNHLFSRSLIVNNECFWGGCCRLQAVLVCL